MGAAMVKPSTMGAYAACPSGVAHGGDDGQTLDDGSPRRLVSPTGATMVKPSTMGAHAAWCRPRGPTMVKPLTMGAHATWCRPRGPTMVKPSTMGAHAIWCRPRGDDGQAYAACPSGVGVAHGGGGVRFAQPMCGGGGVRSQDAPRFLSHKLSSQRELAFLGLRDVQQ